MAYSDSTDYSQVASSVIKDALLLCGGIEDNEQPTGSQEAIALRALNRLVKHWSQKGLKAWCWNEATLTLVAGQASYDLGVGGDLVIPRPLEIRNARKVISTNETEIRIVSRSEYMFQPNKTDRGEPVFVFYDPQLDVGTLYVWPTPDDADSIKFSYRQHIEDFDIKTNDPYFPPEWMRALVYGLASDLIPHYSVKGEDAARIEARAAQFLAEAEDSDREAGSVFLMPEYEY